MNRKLTIVLLALTVVFATSAALFCALLIQNYREQFDMEMTYAEMTRHVRIASAALDLFVIAGVVASWRLVRLVRALSAARRARRDAGVQP